MSAPSASAPTLPAICLPGQPLSTTFHHTPGAGTHLSGISINATLVGIPSTSTTNSTATLTVTNPLTASPLHLPSIHSTALARVTRINPRYATVSILVIDSVPCPDPFQGVIRQQDVRATEKDRVKVYESFRPGDVVRATVISLGDQRDYYLSTAGNSLGVVMARSEDGDEMYPKSWKEMVSSRTGKVELRKVAKPI